MAVEVLACNHCNRLFPKKESANTSSYSYKGKDGFHMMSYDVIGDMVYVTICLEIPYFAPGLRTPLVRQISSLHL